MQSHPRVVGDFNDSTFIIYECLKAHKVNMEKLVSFLIMWTFLLAFERALPQDNQTVYIEGRFKNEQLKKILTDLENKFEITFSYLDQAVENKLITAVIKNQPCSFI